MKPTAPPFLRSLLDAPGPSGFEIAPARIWRKEAETFADRVTADVSGNSIAAVNPDGNPRVMFAGHIDEIGLMVVHVDDEGFLYFQPIGGWDSQVLVGQRVVIAAKSGPVDGVIGKKAIHLISKDERDKVSKHTDLWIDIGAKDKKDAEKRVRIGDPAVIAGGTLELPNGRLVARSIDNRIGAYIVLEALRYLSKKKTKAAAFAVATTQEEIAYASGGGGARTSAVGLTPDVAIVVDVTHASDSPTVEKKEVGDFRLGGGPVLSRGSAVNPIVFEMLVETAEAEKIPYSIEASPGSTGTDADSIYTASRGIPTGLVSVANRYMHSPNEMVDLADLERAAQLLAAFTRRLTKETDFTPR